MKGERGRYYDYNGLAGCVEQRRNRATGFVVGIYQTEQAGMETDAETPWATVCEEHHTICCHGTLALARSHAGDPKGWCEACRKGYLFNKSENAYVVMADLKPGVDKYAGAGLTANRDEATIFEDDDPVHYAPVVAGYGRGSSTYRFVLLTHEDVEREGRKAHREPHWTDQATQRPIFGNIVIDARGHRSNIVSITAAAMSLLGDLRIPYDRVEELSNKVGMALSDEEAIGYVEKWFRVDRGDE